MHRELSSQTASWALRHVTTKALWRLEKTPNKNTLWLVKRRGCSHQHVSVRPLTITGSSTRCENKPVYGVLPEKYFFFHPFGFICTGKGGLASFPSHRDKIIWQTQRLCMAGILLSKPKPMCRDATRPLSQRSDLQFTKTPHDLPLIPISGILRKRF